MGIVVQAVIVLSLSEYLFCVRPPTILKPYIYRSSFNKYFGPKKISLPKHGIKDFVIKPPKDTVSNIATPLKGIADAKSRKTPVFTLPSTKTTKIAKSTKAATTMKSKDSDREDLDSANLLERVPSTLSTSPLPDVTTATTTSRTTTEQTSSTLTTPKSRSGDETKHSEKGSKYWFIKKILDKRLTLLKPKLRTLERKLETAGVLKNTPAIKTDDNSIPGLMERTGQLEKMLLVPTGPDLTFTDKRYACTLNDSRVTSPNGMAFSRMRRDTLYVINDAEDSASDNHLYMFNVTSGMKVQEVTLTDAKRKTPINTAWSDISVGPCADRLSKSCVYILDQLKSVDGRNPGLTIYMFEEPQNATITERYPKKLTKRGYTRPINAIAVSPGGAVYLFLKEHKKYGQRVQKIEKGTIKDLCPVKFKSQYDGPVGADISEDGKMVLVKMLDFIYMYNVPNKNYDEVLCDEWRQIQMNYTTDDRSEAISFSPDGFSYYTSNHILYSPLWRYERRLYGSSDQG